MKVCNKCNIEKPLSEYHIARQGKTAPIYKSHCKECSRKKYKQNYSKLSEEEKRQIRAKNKCNNSEYRKQYMLKTRYGLTTESFSAMIVEQNNMCKICGSEMDAPQVDHNHQTGKVRALLCRPCNTALGLVKEDPAILNGMISYINDYI